jgi:beta-phosphoglucomutase family hydrolase
VHRLAFFSSASSPLISVAAASESSAAGDSAPRTAGARAFDAVIFDMDGVVTRTATVHALAWKRMFDEFLRARAAAAGAPETFREFTPRDYLAHVDGRPRYRGVETFLRSRGVELPFGSPEDGADAATICGLGNRKNAHFNRIVAGEGVGVYDSTIALIRELQRRGIRVGLATSSRNSALVLERTGTAPLFETVVDGLVSEQLGLRGKPEPDIFTTAAAALGVPPARAVVVEDAVSGVQAGARGQFGLVIGLAREDNARELRESGADLVVTDLAETSVEDIGRRLQARRVGAAHPAHPNS